MIYTNLHKVENLLHIFSTFTLMTFEIIKCVWIKKKLQAFPWFSKIKEIKIQIFLCKTSQILVNYLLPRYCVGFMKETGTRKYHHNTVRVKEPQTVKYSLNSSEVEEIFFQCKHVLDQRFNTLVFNQNFFSLSINQGFKTKASTYRKRFFIILLT